MALTQATNISPSAAGSGSLASGVVDVTAGMRISWQVNGTSPMSAYRVVIYDNDAASTQRLDTGRVETGSPFYGKNALGEYEFFHFDLTAAALLAAQIENGGSYKFILTQWWGDTTAESISQSSAAVFYARKAPTLALGTIPGTVDSSSYTFTAAYAQEQGDAVDWVRWEIAEAGDTDSPLYDSGQLYTQVLSCTYDGFLPSENGNRNYAVRCTVQTVSGVEVSTGWTEFLVSYASGEESWLIQTACVPGTGAALITWPLLESIPGSASGGIASFYSYPPYSGISLINLSGQIARVAWDQVGSAQMSFAPPWTAVWRGILTSAATFLTLEMGAASLRLTWDGAGTLRLLFGDDELFSLTDAPESASFVIVLSPENIAWRWGDTDTETGQLYPSEDLYPGNTIYPSAGAWVTESGSTGITFPQGNITRVELQGNCACEYLQILAGELGGAERQERLDELKDYKGWGKPDFGASTYFLAKFEGSYEAGVRQIAGGSVDGYALYRLDGGDGRLLHLADLPGGTTSIYDYGLRNNADAYIWYIYGKSGDSYSMRVKSAPMEPFFWDWVLLSCAEDENGRFWVQQVFRFGANLQSGKVSNGNSPGIFKNFTRFPTVMPAPQNYQSGTLSSLIGAISPDGTYADTREARDAILALGTSGNALFLKNRKGDLLRVRIAGEIGMETSDASATQAQTATVPWVEVGSAESAILLSMEQVESPDRTPTPSYSQSRIAALEAQLEAILRELRKI